MENDEITGTPVAEDQDENLLDELDESTSDEEASEEKDWDAEAKKNAAIAARLKKKLEATSEETPKQPEPLKEAPAPEPDVTERLSKLEQVESKRSFGHAHELSPEETDELFKYAAGGDPEEALKSSFFQAGLKEMRSQKRAEEATPSPSGKSQKIDGKTWDQMDDKEREKNFDKFAKKFKK